MIDVDELVRRLELSPHPEGGFFREVYRDAAVTTIHYVLVDGGLAPLHRVLDRVELWHFYGGAAVELHTIVGDVHRIDTLGPDSPLGIVPAGAWQATRASKGAAWCGCTVAPAFEFSAWEMPARAELARMISPRLQSVVEMLTSR